MKRLASPIPLGLAVGSFFVLGRGSSDRLQCLSAGYDLRPPVDHQQQQNQRPHGAEKDRQEGKGRNLQALAPASHAAPFSVGEVSTERPWGGRFSFPTSLPPAGHCPPPTVLAVNK